MTTILLDQAGEINELSVNEAEPAQANHKFAQL